MSGFRVEGPALARRAAALAMIVFAGLLSACTGTAASGCVRIEVAAAPEIEPIITRQAAAFGGTIHGRCVTVGVRSTGPAQGAAVLSGRENDRNLPRPDAWIPDSSLWIPAARDTASAASIAATGTSLASSPLVFALSAKVAARLPKGRAAPSWRTLLPQKIGAEGAAPSSSAPAFEVADPATTTAGLGTLLAIHRNAPHGERGLAPFAISLYGFQFHLTPDVSGLVSDIARGGRTPVTGVIPEQAVWAQNASDPDEPLAALVPAEGTVYLDYPYVPSTGDRTRAEAVAAFGESLRSPATREAIAAAGFRAPDHQAGDALRAVTRGRPAGPRVLPLPAADVTASIRRMWSRIVLGSQLLVLLDVSPSMGEQVPGTGTSRIRAITKLAAEGLRLFGPSTDNALWVFATKLHGDRDYEQVVPLARLDARRGGRTQREILARTYATAQPRPGTHTGLYDSILASFEYMQKHYAPNRNNFVAVFTDGKNDDPGAGISLRTLEDRIARLNDPARPVAIIPIAFGKDSDPKALDKIAKLTRSQAFVTVNPAQIQQVFLKMLIRLTCDTDCPVP
jgi:hypothetical protein